MKKMGINTKKGISFMLGVALWLYTWAYIHTNGIVVSDLFVPMFGIMGFILRLLSGWMCYSIAKDLMKKYPIVWALFGALAPRIFLFVMYFLPKNKGK